MTDEMMSKARAIIIKARALGAMGPHDDARLIDELVWEILLMSMPSEDPSEDLMGCVDAEAASLAWVEAREQMEDPDAFECRGFTWRQVL